MSENNTSSFLNNLEWRRAVKHFGNKSVDTTPVIRAIVNAPSSFGLQPYKVIAVKNNELKMKIRPASYDQSQITECDTLFIFCARNNISERADEYINAANAEGIRDMLTGFIHYMPDKTAWAIRQAYIALGFGLAACAELQIPSCPMEGFNSMEIHKILGLSENLYPCVMLAVGSATKNNDVIPRFRFPESDIIDERN
jgi:nitroreductase/dihydropteridine reductase